jgi:hypothetical protein
MPFMKKRSIFIEPRIKLFSSALVIYVCLFLLVIALLDWQMLSTYLKIEHTTQRSIRLVFLLANLWMIYVFVLALGIYWSKKKFGFILERLDAVCLDIARGNLESKIRYREKDPFDFFSRNFNRFVFEKAVRRNRALEELERLRTHLDRLPEQPGDPDLEMLTRLLSETHPPRDREEEEKN